ncbi:MAG TPA: hypothetical protein VFU31_13610 [Candidatus Binatia bacterium]|nr:hypothetical protein [Candidatus Binatia bacterium]
MLVGLLSTDTSIVAEKEHSSTGRGNVGSLLANYKVWEAAYIKNGGDQNMILPIGPFKGLSTKPSDAFGQAK